MKRTVSVNRMVDVDIEISDIDTDDLIDELESRGIFMFESDHQIKTDICVLFELKRTNDIRFEKAFADYIYENIGRIL